MKPQPTYRRLTPLADVLLQGGPTVRGGVEKLLEEYRKNPGKYDTEVQRVTHEAMQRLRKKEVR